MESVWKSLCNNRDQIRFHMEQVNGPYKEAYGQTKNQLSWNGYYRYGKVLAPLLSYQDKDRAESQYIFDILLHYLVDTEFCSGLSETEIKTRIKWEQLEHGAYGDTIQQLFECQSEEEKHYLAYQLNHQERSGTSIAIFTEVILYLLGNVLLYWQPKHQDQLILCISHKQNRGEDRKIELATELFLPLSFSIRIYWNGHIPVIGEEVTMKIDQIQL